MEDSNVAFPTSQQHKCEQCTAQGHCPRNCQDVKPIVIGYSPNYVLASSSGNVNSEMVHSQETPIETNSSLIKEEIMIKDEICDSEILDGSEITNDKTNYTYFIKEIEPIVHLEYSIEEQPPIKEEICDSEMSSIALNQSPIEENDSKVYLELSLTEDESVPKNAASGRTKKNQPIKCPYAGCDFVGKHQITLYPHIRLRHSNDEPPKISSSSKLLCTFDGCDYSCMTKSDLTAHVNRRHHKIDGPQEPPENEPEPHKRILFRCSLEGCDFETSNSVLYENHSLSGHDGPVAQKETFNCLMPDCRRTFVTYGLLSQHLRSKHNFHSFGCACDQCNQSEKTTIVNVSSTGEHYPNISPESVSSISKTNNDQKTFSCVMENCPQVFLSEDDLQRHSLSHPLICGEPDCKKMFLTIQTLKTHRKKFHTMKWQCMVPGCEYNFSHEYEKLTHYRNDHINDEKYVCPHEGCSKRFLFKNSLRKHHVIHNRSKIACPKPECPATFTTQAAMKSHVCERDKNWQCMVPDCGKQLSNHSERLRHYRDDHINDEKYVCPQEGCSKRFLFKGSLRGHRAVHRAQVTCPNPECPATFATEGSMVGHVCFENKKWNCMVPDCGKQFGTQSERLRHYRDDHINDEKYVCPKEGCSKRFLFKASSRRHICVNNSSKTSHDMSDATPENGSSSADPFERPKPVKLQRRPKTNVLPHGDTASRKTTFTCNLPGCSQQFNNVFDRTRHHKYDHINDRKFVCPKEDCKRRFLFPRTWREHRRWHKGRQPAVKINCPVPNCYITFGNRFTLIRHMLFLHRKHPPECECGQCNSSEQEINLEQHKCEKCPGFAYTSQFLNSDRKEKWFKCTVVRCLRVFKLEQNLIEHFHYKHLGPGLTSVSGIHKPPSETHSTPTEESDPNVNLESSITEMVENISTNIPAGDSETQHQSEKNELLQTHEPREVNEPPAHSSTSDGSSTSKRSEKIIACDIPKCSTVFFTQSDMRNHYLNHKFKKERKVICCEPGCRQKFANKQTLRSHRSRIHIKEFHCKISDCQQKFSNSFDRMRHARYDHTNDRKYVCPTEGCNHRYLSMGGLKQHQLVHEGLQPAPKITCAVPECHRIFIDRSRLNKHMTSEHQIHTFECKCDQCNSSFEGMHQQLKKHYIQHKCEHCPGFAFTHQFLNTDLKEKLFKCTAGGCFHFCKDEKTLIEHFHSQHFPSVSGTEFKNKLYDLPEIPQLQNKSMETDSSSSQKNLQLTSNLCDSERTPIETESSKENYPNVNLKSSLTDIVHTVIVKEEPSNDEITIDADNDDYLFRMMVNYEKIV